MKRKSLFFAIITITIAMLSSCAKEKSINGTVYKPYGFANESTCKNDSVQYEISFGSVLCAVVFCETIIVPIYVVGWDLYEPIDKIDPKLKGVVN